MALRSNEINPEVGSVAPVSSPLQHEADSVRFDGKGLADSFEKAVAEVPIPVATGIGLVGGVLARLPGNLGLAGKVTSIGVGLTFGSDLALRLSGVSNNTDNTTAFLRDGLALGSMGAGLYMAPKLYSELGKAPVVRGFASPEDSVKVGSEGLFDLASKPIIGRGENGTAVILGKDGAAASLKDGVWQHGILFDRSILDFNPVTDPSEAGRILKEAADALLKR